MARLILWSVLALVAWQWWRGALRPPSSPATAGRGQSSPGKHSVPSPLMRPCAHCGVHLAPEVQLPGRDAAVYCCHAHREAREPQARA